MFSIIGNKFAFNLSTGFRIFFYLEVSKNQLIIQTPAEFVREIRELVQKGF